MLRLTSVEKCELVFRFLHLPAITAETQTASLQMVKTAGFTGCWGEMIRWCFLSIKTFAGLFFIFKLRQFHRHWVQEIQMFQRLRFIRTKTENLNLKKEKHQLHVFIFWLQHSSSAWFRAQPLSETRLALRHFSSVWLSLSHSSRQGFSPWDDIIQIKE